MKYITVFLLMASISCTHKDLQDISRIPAGNETQNFWDSILPFSSTGDLQIESGRLILDNDEAFQAKIEMIRNAKKSIRLSYYIYSNDYSSSVFTSELIKAAHRGVKVQMMVDALTNYYLADLFSYIEKAGRGNIEIRFYHRPSSIIMNDFDFISRPCLSEIKKQDECSKLKRQQIAQELKHNPNYQNGMPYFAGLLLSSVYAKSLTGLKTVAILGSQVYDPTSKAPDYSPQDIQDLKDLLTLVYKAHVKGDVEAMVKLSVAMAVYQAKIQPVLGKLYGTFPVLDNQQALAEWEHLSDFTHHKILIIDEDRFQLGGRNIEDSYHMKPNPLVATYLFQDTDFNGFIKSGGHELVRSFDRLYNFSSMTISLDEILKILPPDDVMNADILDKQLSLCLQEKNRTYESSVQCMQKARQIPNWKTASQREASEAQNLERNVQTYAEYAKTIPPYRGWNPQGQDQVSAADLGRMKLAYFENLPFNKDDNPAKRLYGARVGQEAENGKYIHAALLKGLENVCRTSLESGAKKRIVFHTAYLFLPADIISAFKKMLDGTWDCRNVQVTLITNSFDTTDLNVINVLAKYQLAAFFDIYDRRNLIFGFSNFAKGAKFDYYEYQTVHDPAFGSDKNRISLHSKVTLLGDDLLVGSANMDIRSFYMDTNNAIYLHDVKDLAKDYIGYVDSLLSSGRVKKFSDLYKYVNLEQMHKSDREIVLSLLSKLDQTGLIKPKIQDEAVKIMGKVADSIYSSTQNLLSNQLENGQMVKRTFRQQEQADVELKKILQSFDRRFQVF